MATGDGYYEWGIIVQDDANGLLGRESRDADADAKANYDTFRKYILWLDMQTDRKWTNERKTCYKIAYSKVRLVREWKWKKILMKFLRIISLLQFSLHLCCQ